ncbi:MAG TPA: glycosyltransferase family 2 protein [Acidobacteriaceae bacterium]|jgi:glycosyltransferase involved in cell wall biosynthesis
MVGGTHPLHATKGGGRRTLSVVIPVYNGEIYLEQTIRSVLEQSYPAHEVIVVDDGSSDRSLEIAQSFGPPVICLQQKNQGPSVARNVAIERATGEWIALLDADDYWLPGKLEQQMAKLDEEPGAGFIYSGRTMLSVKDGSTYDIPGQPPKWVKDRLRYANPLVPSAVIVTRSLLLENPFRVPFQSSEDWWLFYSLSKQTEFAFLPQPTVVYRVHPASLTHTNWRNVLEKASRVAAAIQEDFTGFRRWKLRHQVNSRLFANAAIAAREQGSAESLRYIMRSLMTWPPPSHPLKRHKLFLSILLGRMRKHPWRK